ncbi:MAG: SpoIID/LytB domain-containing protein [Actinobacteria bacterium]|nr:SpoIID/LytB domain-containing protein [Actinomycetota bacterium]
MPSLRMRRLSPSCVLGLLVAVLVATAAVARAEPAPAPGDGAPPTPDEASSPPVEPVWVLTGGGWGHGVGMSQWGAYGQAQAGRSFEQILTTYYRGTEVSRTGRSNVRVLLADGVPTAAFSGEGALVVVDGNGRKYRIRDGRLTLAKTLVAPIGPKGTKVPLAPPVRVQPTVGVIVSYRDVARRGAYVVQPSAGGLLVVNELPMEAYLRGVLPGEVPYGWPIEALKAQAVAARTYAFTSLKPDSPWDVYTDVRSQVYGGVPLEKAETDRAILETSGRILLYQGAPARTFYFSSSGGRTFSAREIFGGDTAYLQAVDDPWDATSPHHAWPLRTFSPTALGRAFGLSGLVTEIAPATQEEGRVPAASGPTRIRVQTANGKALELTRTEIRTRLGLLSTRFRFGYLSLATPTPSAVPRAVVTIDGVARDVESPILERRRPDGSWQVIRDLDTRPDGTFTATVRPVETTVFRLSGSGAEGPSVRAVVSRP